MSLKIVETGDGSHTLYNASLNETYHSSHGALTESKHVFIEAGLECISSKKEEINILEIGFGTGLNAILSLEWAKTHPDKKVNYVGLEPFPVSAEIVENLNYVSSLAQETHPFFTQLHQINWNEKHELLENFSFLKVDQKLEDFDGEVDSFDLVYYDAFAPRKQPEMWAIHNLQKAFILTKENGVLVTYCANGQFKRNLKAVGYSVENIAGPPGKREMTRGFKNV